jgi:hypothetical protein
MSWTMFHRQFEAIVGHNWAPWEEATCPLALLQGQAADVLHSIPAEAMYEEIIEALEGHYADHQLAQEFPTSIEQSACQALGGLPQHFNQRETACAFIDSKGPRGEVPSVKRTMDKAQSQALRLEAVKVTGGAPERLHMVRAGAPLGPQLPATECSRTV